MPSAHKQIATHPAAHERVIQMQLIDTPHDRQVGRRNWPGPAIETASAQLKDFRLPLQGKVSSRSIIVWRSSGRLCQAQRTKNRSPADLSRAQLPDLRVQPPSNPPPAHPRSPAPDPNTPAAPSRGCTRQARDLVRLNIEYLRQLRQRLVTLDRRHGHLRLEAGCVVPARASRHMLS